MAEPQVIQCAGECTVTVMHEFVLPLFQLTAEEGAQIAGAVLLVWAVSWAFRQLIVLFRDSGSQPEKED